MSDSFGPCVKSICLSMRDYLGRYPWEQQIQNEDFHEKIRNDRSGKEDLGKTIGRAIFVEQFDYLATLLDSAMEKEMVSTTPNEPSRNLPAQGWEINCGDSDISIEIEASAQEVHVNDPVTFTPKLVKTPAGYWFTYWWSADEGGTSWNRLLGVSL